MVEYFIPKTLTELLEIINEYETKIISGGTDLMVQRRNWAELPAKFEKAPVFIFNIKELNYIKIDGNFIHIGACTPVSDILAHKDTPELLKESIRIMASPALRNLATLPGNIMNASPAGDTLPILYTLNALVVVRSIEQEFMVPVSKIIRGPRKTTLNKNEMIREIIIPLSTFTKEQFVKVGGRKADAISKLNFTGVVNIENDVVEEFRVAFGAVGPTIIRDREIEDKYQLLSLDEFRSKKEEIIAAYDKIIKPIDDQRSNKEYRKKVAINLLKDFINSI